MIVLHLAEETLSGSDDILVPEGSMGIGSGVRLRACPASSAAGPFLSFAAGEHYGGAAHGVFEGPTADIDLVVACGRGYLVRETLTGFESREVTEWPITSVLVVYSPPGFVIATPWAVTFVGPNGEVWTSRRLALDGIELTAAEGCVSGIADPGLGDRVFRLDLHDGRLLEGTALEW